MGAPLNIKQLIVDPWSANKGQVILWIAATNGLWKKVDDGDWTLMEFTFDDPMGEGITYDDIEWRSLSGNICREGHFAFLGMYSYSGAPRAVAASTVDNGVTFKHSVLKSEVSYFNPSMLTDAIRCGPAFWDHVVTGEIGPIEPGIWFNNNIATFIEKTDYRFSNADNRFACGDFGQTLTAGDKIYVKARGVYPDHPNSYVWRVSVAPNQDPCFGGPAWTSMQHWKSTDFSVHEYTIPGSWPPEVETLYVAGGNWYTPIPPSGQGNGIEIDSIWADPESPDTHPHNIVVDTDEGRYAYFTCWIPWHNRNNPALDQWLIKLYRFDFDGNAAAEIEEMKGPLTHHAIAIGHQTQYDYDYPQHHVYVHHPYGFGSDEILAYGGQNAQAAAPYFGWPHNFNDTTPVAMKYQIGVVDNCPRCVSWQPLHPPVAEGKYTAHLSAATGDEDDLMAFVNAHASGALELYRSLSGGASWLTPKEAPSGILRWNACHRHPSGGDRVFIAPANKAQETKDGGDTWLDRDNPALPGGFLPTSIAYKWW